MTNQFNQDKKKSVEKYLAIRKEAAKFIDPETAESCWHYAQIFDPYGVNPDLPDELYQIGRCHFARAPGSDIWVSFYDLPDEIVDKLWARNQSKFTRRA